ncbi:MAG: hypothetical protein P1V81_03535 [Planctomycetota bacterium]|nr:hypothetical protein [Planctomycetota bacterium]
MHWISSDSLVERFRTNRFESGEVEPYFFATMLVGALGMVVPGYVMTAWDLVAGIAGIAITIWGLLHLKAKNGGSFGGGFLERYFALGWVTGVRLFLFSIPVAVVFFGAAAVVGGDDALDPAFAVFAVTMAFAWYHNTGRLFAASQAGGVVVDDPEA